MNELVIAGGGAGDADYILPAAVKAAEESDCVIASDRYAEFLNIKKHIPFRDVYGILAELPSMLEKESVTVIVSGDPLMYSFFRTVRERYPEMDIRVIPGVGSLQMLGSAFGITMENARIISIHGREFSEGKIAREVSGSSAVFFLCCKASGPREIAEVLLKYNLADCEMYVGSNLSYEDEELFRGKPEDFINCENPDLCTAAVVNKNPVNYVHSALLPDRAFLRNETPMTKEEIRAVVMSKLQLKPDSTVWDIGAGTGSISAECARFCPFGQVYSVEYRDTALEILEKNREYFGLENMNIIKGRAEDVISKLPLPDAVFIGGTGKHLGEITEILKSLGGRVRIVMTAVTVETQSEAFGLLKDMPDFDMIQMNISGIRRIGSYTVMENNNPVMIYSCFSRQKYCT